jgi:hypothetical protein
MFRPKWLSSGSRTCFVSYCTVIQRCLSMLSITDKVGTNIKYACEFLKFVVRNKRWSAQLWRSVNRKNIWDVNVGCNMYKYVRMKNNKWCMVKSVRTCVLCPMVYRSGMPWGITCCLIFGTGDVCVVLSVGILPELLVYCFINGVVLFHAKFVHMCILFAGKEYVVLFEAIQKFSFSSFPQYCQCLIYASICVSCI